MFIHISSSLTVGPILCGNFAIVSEGNNSLQHYK
jgi:hypothetical protein